MDKLNIPKKIKVGFVRRKGTYNGKLAYVSYYDDKGKFRKEKSWENWRDNKISPKEFNNDPVDGFVLNKKAGGHSSGWNNRQTYCRVYDPRGFEFEITIENLLFILQECDSHKGKAIEGSFVYSWQGKDIVLLPTHAVDYQKSINHTAKMAKKFSSKELEIGCSYSVKKCDDIYVYLGRFNASSRKTIDSNSGRFNFYNISKSHVFHNLKRNKHEVVSVMNIFDSKISEESHDDYSNQLESFRNSEYYGDFKEFIIDPITYTYDINKAVNHYNYGQLNPEKLIRKMYIEISNKVFILVGVHVVKDEGSSWYYESRKYSKFRAIKLTPINEVHFNDNDFKVKKTSVTEGCTIDGTPYKFGSELTIENVSEIPFKVINGIMLNNEIKENLIF